MPSNTTPPSDSPITSLYLSDTFYTWHTKTNDLISKVNPIEVYSITGNTGYGYDGITLDADGYGNWTIGYQLPMVISGGHTFAGDIHFQAGISGHLVNTFNNATGDVEGVYTISGYTHGSTPDFNVEGAVFSINGVTGTTYGALTIDGSDIPNTIGAVTGPAGYILTAGGTNGFTQPTYLFSAQPTGGQTAFRVNPLTNQVSINSNTFGGGGSGSKLLIQGKDGEHALRIISNTEYARDIDFNGSGQMGSNSSIYFLSGHDGTTCDYSFIFGGSTSGQVWDNNNTDAVFRINPNAYQRFDASADIDSSDLNSIVTIDHKAGQEAHGMRINTSHTNGAHDIVMGGRGSIYTGSGFAVYSSQDINNHGTSSLFRVVHGETHGGYTAEVFAVNSKGAIGLKQSNVFGTDGMYLGSQGEGNAAKWLDFPVMGVPTNVGGWGNNGTMQMNHISGTANINMGDTTNYVQVSHGHGAWSHWYIYLNGVLYAHGGNYDGDPRWHNTHRVSTTVPVAPGFILTGSGSNEWQGVIW